MDPTFNLYLKPVRIFIRNGAPRSPQNHNFPETSVVRRYERRISKGIGSPYIRAEAKLVSVVRPFGQKIGPVSRAQKTGFF